MHKADQPTPVVFQAAGANAASIQSSVDAFRAALGEPNNLNNPGPLAKRSARDQLGWWQPQRPGYHSPGKSVPRVPEHPRQPVQNTRVGAFAGSSVGRTAGRTGRALWQSHLRPNLQNIQSLAFVHSCGKQHHRSVLLHTGYQWHCPRQQLEVSARCSQTLTSQMARAWHKARQPPCEHAHRVLRPRWQNCIFSSFVPASPGDGSLSFFGIVFDDARIASVRIRAGDVAPGPNDDRAP